jgi:hypothetical protein
VRPARLMPALLAALALAAPAPARSDPGACGPRYYVILFGADAGPLHPTRAHTWATYIKATPGPGGGHALEQVTISWLPADGTIDALRPFRTEPGVNLNLHQSLLYAAGRGARVAMWGPYETDALRYELAVYQAARLEGGAVRYRAVDSFNHLRPGVDHCVHAVTGAEPLLAHRRQPVFRIGRRGTAHIAGQYARAGAFDTSVRHDWILTALGLDHWPVARH